MTNHILTDSPHNFDDAALPRPFPARQKRGDVYKAGSPSSLGRTQMRRYGLRGGRDVAARRSPGHEPAEAPAVTLSPVRPFRMGVKLVLDCAIAGTALLLLLPLLLVIAAFVRADGGPALFGHVRIGRDGGRFRCLKFRTMCVDADRVLKELLANDKQAAAEWEETRKLVADPRVTAIGAFLRRTSLDELPQLLNVLRGEMSLVGPRPIVDAEVPRYADNIAYYYAAKPGITGLWQVSGRSNTSYALRVQLDVSYVREWSLSRDIAILARTVPAVLLRQGAV
jgi:Undecaprenyl-phosphate galactose phosphotransferase WbaP